jgi:glycolate oxidase FAD binding subunit
MDLSVAVGLDAARSLDPARHAIGGRTPRLAVRPVSQAEAIEVVAAAARDRLALVPWGGGTSLTHAMPPARYDVALDLSGLKAIVDHQPEDLTLIAEAGVTIAALRAECMARGQELPLEAAAADRATFGGVLAANASGARRRRYGAPRDRVLGMRYVAGDGVAARAGGRVVKNVAGHGIQRLLCGSRGGLAIVLEAAIKLAPAPAVRVAMAWPADPARAAAAWDAPGARDAAAFSLARGFPPPGAAATRPWWTIVVLEDDAPWVREQERSLVAAMGTPALREDGGGVTGWLQWLADLEASAAPCLTATTANARPAAIARFEDGAPLAFHVPAGRLHLFPGERPAPATWRAAEAAGFTPLEVRAVPGEEPIEVPAPPADVALAALRRRIRAAFDPHGILPLGDRP